LYLKKLIFFKKEKNKKMPKKYKYFDYFSDEEEIQLSQNTEKNESKKEIIPPKTIKSEISQTPPIIPKTIQNPWKNVPKQIFNLNEIIKEQQSENKK
jgi:hypothetical protein